MESVTVRTATRDESARAVGILVLAFTTDPVCRWLYPDPHQYLSHFPSFIREFGGKAFETDTAWVTEGFEGASFLLPPGVHLDGEALGEVLQQSIQPELGPEAFPLLAEMGKFHPQEPHWYLPIIGVDPDRQGRGIGSALLRHALEACDRDGVCAFLESSNPANVPLYQRHGFEVVGELQRGSSPTFFPMLRPAR